LIHTFDIRFARSAGISAWLEEPVNRFRWKGAGRLSISRDVITIAARRGLASLFRHSPPRRIAAADLREVYREGAALRLEFSTEESVREVLPLWVDDRDTAASIVKLLPTTQTVELEDAPARATPRVRWDRGLLATLSVLVATLAGLAWILTRDEPVTASAAPAFARGATDSAPATPVLTNDILVVQPTAESLLGTPLRPVPAGTPASEAGRRAFTQFDAQAQDLLLHYQRARADLEAGALTHAKFAEVLASIEPGWWNVTFRLLETDGLADPALAELRATMLASARNWRGFLASYAEGMKADDPEAIRRSFELLDAAERLQVRARMMLY
jgi:hypothetical protein